MGIVVVSHSEILPYTPWDNHCHNKVVLNLGYGEIVTQFLNLCVFSHLLIWMFMPYAIVHIGTSKGSLWHQHSAFTMLETEFLILWTGFAQANWSLRFFRVIEIMKSAITSRLKEILGTWTHTCVVSALPLIHLTIPTIMELEFCDCPQESIRVQILWKNKSMVSQPIKDIIPMWSHSSSGGYLPKITEIGNQNRYLYADTHRSCIHYIWRENKQLGCSWMDGQMNIV